eukprot:scaffold65389_cov35-Tisochrysis_lutea.AAC.5
MVPIETSRLAPTASWERYVFISAASRPSLSSQHTSPTIAAYSRFSMAARSCSSRGARSGCGVRSCLNCGITGAAPCSSWCTCA